MMFRTLAHSHTKQMLPSLCDGRHTLVRLTGALMLAILMTACGAKAPPADPEPDFTVRDSVVWNDDVDLAPVLVRPQLGAVEKSAAERIEIRLGPTEFYERLGVVVEDTTAPWLVRINAMKLLAERGALGEMPAFATALQSRDERLRIAAAGAMREYMVLRPDAATEILLLALNDRSHRVQTTALQILGDRDVALLRGFYAKSTHPEVRKITLDLMRAAEARGAPLVEKDTLGTLERTTSLGTIITFKPTQRWRQWDAAVGVLSLTVPGKKPVVVASGVEVVGKVVPAFFTSDEKTLVYEVNREVHAHDVETGDDRKLADGIAPRMLPFTNDVIYFSEIRARRLETPNTFNLKYDVLRVPVAGGTPTSIGQVGTAALNELKGNYSPMRWSRVQELEGNFTLVGAQMEPFKLPNPFGEK